MQLCLVGLAEGGRVGAQVGASVLRQFWTLIGNTMVSKHTSPGLEVEQRPPIPPGPQLQLLRQFPAFGPPATR